MAFQQTNKVDKTWYEPPEIKEFLKNNKAIIVFQQMFPKGKADDNAVITFDDWEYVIVDTAFTGMSGSLIFNDKGPFQFNDYSTNTIEEYIKLDEQNETLNCKQNNINKLDTEWVQIENKKYDMRQNKKSKNSK